jgi:nitrous oxidase accessory protein
VNVAALIPLAALLASLPAAARQIQGRDSSEHGSPAQLATPAVKEPEGDVGRAIARAAAGDTVRIPAGVYHEHIVLDKPLTLVAAGHAVLDGGDAGDVVVIAAPNVTLDGFVVRGSGIDLAQEHAGIRVLAPHATIQNNTLEDVLFGIDLRAAPDSVVRHNTIGGKDLDIARRGDGLRLWRSDRTLVENNTSRDGRDAILWYSSSITVRGNSFTNCRYGLHLMFSDDVRIEDNRLSRNSVGVYLMYSSGIVIKQNRFISNRGPSGYAIGLKEADKYSITDNLIVGNRAGLYIDGSPFTTAQPGVVTRNTVAYNDVGLLVLPSARGNEFTENNFIDNIDQVSVAGRGDLEANRFWKGERGNFWSDYTGYDQDHDGVGDFVHESQTLFENLMDREPNLRLFLFSPAQQAIEFVGRAVPSIRPEPKFTDEVPLMRPVPVACAERPAPRSLAFLGSAGAALLALGAGIISAARPFRLPSPRNVITGDKA